MRCFKMRYGEFSCVLVSYTTLTYLVLKAFINPLYMPIRAYLLINQIKYLSEFLKHCVLDLKGM